MKTNSLQKQVKKVGAKAPAVKESQQTDSAAKKRSGRKSKDFAPVSRSTSGIVEKTPSSDSVMDHEDEEGILFQESLREAKKRKMAAKMSSGKPKKSRLADLLASPSGSDQEDPEFKEEEVIDFSDSEGQDLDEAPEGVPDLPGKDVHSPRSLGQEDPPRIRKKSRAGHPEEGKLDLLSPTVGVTLA